MLRQLGWGSGDSEVLGKPRTTVDLSLLEKVQLENGMCDGKDQFK